MLDRHETANLLAVIFPIVMRLEAEFYEKQMAINGTAFSFRVVATDGFVAVEFADFTVWSSEENDPKDEQTVEADIRKEIEKIAEALSALSPNEKYTEEFPAEVQSLLNDLLSWRDYMGGWDAPVWQKCEQMRDALSAHNGITRHFLRIEETKEARVDRFPNRQKTISKEDLAAYLEMASIAFDVYDFEKIVADRMDLSDEEMARLGKQLREYLNQE